MPTDLKLQHINVKLYCKTSDLVDLSKLIPTFHRWIQYDLIANEALIDVADYRHVPAGPGVILIGHNAFYSIEAGAEKRLGLLYNRRTRAEQSNKDNLAQALKTTLQVKELLEKEKDWQGKISFSTDEVKIMINDRCNIENNETSFNQLKNDIYQGCLEGLGVSDINLHYNKAADHRCRFEVIAKT